MDLENRAVLVAGRFGRWRKAAVIERLTGLGARVVRRVAAAEVLMVGARPGAALERARERGLEVIDGAAWMAAGSSEAPEAPPTEPAQAAAKAQAADPKRAVASKRAPEPAPQDPSELALGRLKALVARDIAGESAWADSALEEYSLTWGWQWQAVRGYFKQWQRDDPAPMLEAARSVLDWPVRVRSATTDEIKQLLTTGSCPVLELAANLTPHGLDPRDFKASLALCQRVEVFPNVRHLVLSNFEPDQITALLDTPLAQQITAIYMGYHDMGARHIRAIAASPVASRLESLTLYRGKIGVLGMGELAKHPWPSLRRLDLTHGHSTGAGLDALATGAFPALEELVLSEHKLKGADVKRWLKAAPWTRRLRLLDFKYNDLTAVGARALAQHPFERLEVLGLSANEIGDKGLAALASSKHMRHLRDLHVAGNHRAPLITDEGLAALTSSPYMGNLERLDMILNTFGWESLVAMLSSPNLGSLRSVMATHNSNLDLSKGAPLAHLQCASPLQRLEFCHTSPSQPEKLAGVLQKAAWPSTLESLNLASIPLDHKALTALCALPVTRRLAHLELNNTPTTPENIALLARTPFERLRVLGLNPYGDSLDPGSARELVSAPWFAGLERVVASLSGAPESKTIVQKAAARHDVYVMAY